MDGIDRGARAVAVHAQRALHGSGRGRHRGRQRGRLGVRADARSAGEGPREHPEGRHPRPTRGQRFLGRAGLGHRAREGRHRQTHRPHRSRARSRKPRARQDPGQRRAGAGAGIGRRRAHDRLRQGGRRHRGWRDVGDRVRGGHDPAHAAGRLVLRAVAEGRGGAHRVLPRGGGLAARHAGAARLRHRSSGTPRAVPDLRHRRVARRAEDQRRQGGRGRRRRQHATPRARHSGSC